MFSSNKILSIIFILLFLLLIGEVVYLMNIKNSPQKNKVEVSSTNQNLLIQVTQPVQNKKEEEPLLINKGLIGYLKSRRQTNNQMFFLTEEVFGNISDLFEEGGELGITIVDDNKKRVLTFMRMRDEKTKFYRKLGDKQVTISEKDLKIGDKILFRSYTDMIKNIEISAEIILDYKQPSG